MVAPAVRVQVSRRLHRLLFVYTPPEGTSVNVQAIQGNVAGIDAGYKQYQAITGREPQWFSPTVLNGRSTIAEVPDGRTCGAGCGYLGFTGIEMMSTYFDVLYTGYVQHAQYDQEPFYELGRNFWFYGDQLATVDPFVTGFAIANRFISMELAGLPGGPFNGSLDFETFKESIVVDLLNGYLGDPTLNWENTLKVNQAPPNPHGWSAADLAGAMFYRVFQENGLSGYRAFFAALVVLPHASSSIDAISHFISAARTATGRDYTYLFMKAPGVTTNAATEVGQTGATLKSVGNINALRPRSPPLGPRPHDVRPQTRTLQPRWSRRHSAHDGPPRAPTAPARLSGILGRHTAAVNPQVGPPDQHG